MCDICLFMEKNEVGEWNIVGKVVRCGYKYGLLVNLFGGFDVLIFDFWFEDILKK